MNTIKICYNGAYLYPVMVNVWELLTRYCYFESKYLNTPYCLASNFEETLSFLVFKAFLLWFYSPNGLNREHQYFEYFCVKMWIFDPLGRLCVGILPFVRALILRKLYHALF